MSAEPTDLQDDSDGSGLYLAPAPDAPAKRGRLSRPQLRLRAEHKLGHHDGQLVEDCPDCGSGTVATRPSGERAPRTRSAKRKKPASPGGGSRRAPMDETIGALYGGLGQMLAAVPSPLMPAGRAMQLNAVVVGTAADDALKGSWVDKKLQPLAKRKDKLAALKNAVGLPAIAAVIGLRPELYPALAPFGVALLRANIAAMGPELVKMREQEQATQQTIVELVEAQLLPLNEDGTMPTITDLWTLMFAPPPMPEPPEPAPGG